LSKENDLSHAAHIAVASFIAAAHTTMLKWLKRAQEGGASDLHTIWHQLMEPAEERADRNSFFSDVVKLANTASHSLSSVDFPL